MSLSPHLSLHLSLPVERHSLDHLGGELTAKVTVEDLWYSKHCKHMAEGGNYNLNVKIMCFIKGVSKVIEW